MHKRDLVLGLLREIYEIAEIIRRRFEPIEKPEDFTTTEWGREKLDAIALPLIAIGEDVKRIDRLTDGELLARYPSVDWTGAMATRDKIVHGYINIDAVIVFDICAHFLPDLAAVVRGMIGDFESE